jgi:hypothetical protein
VFKQSNIFVPTLSQNARHVKARLPFYAVMMLVLWVMVASQFSKNLDFSDDSSRVRVEQSREINADNDSNLDDFPNFAALSYENVSINLFVICLVVSSTTSIILLRNCLTQIRPRSPPL